MDLKPRKILKSFCEKFNTNNRGTYFEPKDIILSEYLDNWLENYAKPNSKLRNTII